MSDFRLCRGKYDGTSRILVEDVLLSVVLNPPPSAAWTRVHSGRPDTKAAYARQISVRNRFVSLVLNRGQTQEELRMELPLSTLYFHRAVRP